MNLPRSEEVEQSANEVKHYDGPQGQYAVKYLRQFAALLHDMEAAGSPVTDALVAGLDTCGDLARIQDELISNGRHFEQLAGAIEARTVERCEKVLDKLFNQAHADAKVACERGWFNEAQRLHEKAAGLHAGMEAIRALPHASERRIRGERRIRVSAYCEGANDRRKGEA